MEISASESSLRDQKRFVVSECQKIIDKKNSGELTEEKAAYSIVALILDQSEQLQQIPEFGTLLDCAGEVEKPRELSYRQEIGLGIWDAKTADSLKKAEWQELLSAIKAAEETL